MFEHAAQTLAKATLLVTTLSLLGACSRRDICDTEVGAAAGTYRVLVNGQEAMIQIDPNGRAYGGTGSNCTATKSRPCTLTVRCDDGLSVSIERVASQ
jgi:hypothetical protein